MSPTVRNSSVDLIRAAALVGICVVNLPFHALPLDVLLSGPSDPVDLKVAQAVSLLFEGKFFLLFSFLFGWGLEVQMTSAARAGASFRARYLRRLAGLLVLGVVLAAVHYLIIRKTGGVEAAVPMLFYPVFGQTVVAFMLLPGSYVPMPLADVATFVLLAAGGFAGTLMMIAAYRVAAPVVVAPTQYTQIAWAALFGAVFFDEPMTLDAVLGMGIIAVSGMIVVIRQNRPRTA